MNLYLPLNGFLECVLADLLPEEEESVILLTRERCRTLLDIIPTVSRLRSLVNLQVHFKISFGILFPSA